MKKTDVRNLPVYTIGKPDVRNLPKDVADDLYSFLLDRVLECLKNPENRKKIDEWKAQELAAGRDWDKKGGGTRKEAT